MPFRMAWGEVIDLEAHGTTLAGSLSYKGRADPIRLPFFKPFFKITLIQDL